MVVVPTCVLMAAVSQNKFCSLVPGGLGVALEPTQALELRRRQPDARGQSVSGCDSERKLN